MYSFGERAERQPQSNEATHELVTPERSYKDREILALCASYFEAEAERYDDRDADAERRRLYTEGIDSYVVDQLASFRPSRILSFGCGTGRREQRIRERVSENAHVVGIDSSSSMRRLAKQRGLETFPALTPTLLRREDPVDSVLCLWAFGHSPSHRMRRRLLGRFHQMLSKSGVLILDVFNIDDMWSPEIRCRPQEVAGGSIYAVSGDVFYRRVGTTELCYLHLFTVGEITALLEEAGFVMQDVTGVGYGLDPGRIGVPLDKGSLVLTCRKRSS